MPAAARGMLVIHSYMRWKHGGTFMPVYLYPSMMLLIFCSHTLSIWTVRAKKRMRWWFESGKCCLMLGCFYKALHRLLALSWKSFMQSLQQTRRTFLWSGKCQSWHMNYWFPDTPDWICIFPALSHMLHNTKHSKAGMGRRDDGFMTGWRWYVITAQGDRFPASNWWRI